MNPAKPARNKIRPFLFFSFLFILICCSAALGWIFLPSSTFDPMPKIEELPASRDLLVFTANIYTNLFSTDNALLAVDIETGKIYNWLGMSVTEVSWSGKRDKALIFTEGDHSDDPSKNFLVSIDGKTEQIAVDGEGFLSPDGKKIAYTKSFSLFIYDLDTLQTTQVSLPKIPVSGQFAWSLDSKYIAFVSGNGGYDKESDHFEIVRVDVNHGTIVHLTGAIAGKYVNNLQWSEDGTELSVDYYAGYNNAETNVIFTNGHEPWQMPQVFYRYPLDLSYVWLHQDSKLSILWKGETWQLWMIDPYTNESKLIRDFRELDLKEGYGVTHMVWSPDDTKLAFTAIGTNAHCHAGFDTGGSCSEDIYVFDTKKNTLKKVPVSPWLEFIRDIAWIRISQ